MDHVVYLDAKANELEKLLDGSKTMIIRGATGRKLPYGRVNQDDTLYFINNNAEGVVKAKATVNNVFNSDKLSPEESVALVEENQSELNLSGNQIKKWAGKRYLVLIELKKIEEVKAFEIDKSNYGNMDDWLPVGKIESVKK
ncbi:MAG: hypothetical protein OZ913_09930 [Ignavibacteriaceae bacterium]|jgi:hypothetical protein|nr:MAG: hypothetical protein EDM69_10390 [Chlorobiota bacterium]MBV6397834.1 hypothetical protein [Ignavibacteria bacterium]MCC6884886.1 hypothetical protein [Ignavibacteriales bacterium]MCE7954021.1 hypothetical protein [Chlorobi bacterium CHB7]MDL1887963.1 hypothetical protein [Ignavibacteria bacterium CHB1]MEB2330599.1 hypothetical protein [Ignavibacteriaceae bacterium]OQY78635.1 MAG: hypothetical protein B6D43_02215 [Ignavibacteriales bacterium UTCHB1]RIK47495.1 MAG: hypothetical protein